MCTFPAGFKGGGGPITFSYPRFNGVRSVYVHFGLKLSPNWFNHSQARRCLLRDRSDPSGGRPFYVVLFGYGNGSIRFQMNTQSPESGSLPDASEAYRLNRGSGGSDQIVRGRWYNIEMVLTLNDIGSANGEIHAWINGTKILEYKGLRIVSNQSDGTLNTLKWNPTYGGSSSEHVPAEQYQYIDHIYLSGRR